MWLLLQRGWDSGELCPGPGWVALMPQVSACACGTSPAVQEREGEVVLQCHPPSCWPAGV